MSVVGIKPSPSAEIVADLRRLADRIEAGEVDAAFGVSVVAGPRTGVISISLLGESRRYSEIMGLLAYGQCHCYQQANA